MTLALKLNNTIIRYLNYTILLLIAISYAFNSEKVPYMVYNSFSVVHDDIAHNEYDQFNIGEHKSVSSLTGQLILMFNIQLDVKVQLMKIDSMAGQLPLMNDLSINSIIVNSLDYVLRFNVLIIKLDHNINEFNSLISDDTSDDRLIIFELLCYKLDQSAIIFKNLLGLSIEQLINYVKRCIFYDPVDDLNMFNTICSLIDLLMFGLQDVGMSSLIGLFKASSIVITDSKDAFMINFAPNDLNINVTIGSLTGQLKLIAPDQLFI
jgi:hypothetical protein